jgi:hypothetical protein
MNGMCLVIRMRQLFFNSSKFILCHHLILLSNKNNCRLADVDTLLAECLFSNSEQSIVKMERLDKLLQT